MTDETPTTPPPGRPYHHGDLRRTVLTAATEVIAEQGPAALSLRGLARRAGVSHAAPAHHFGDKAGVLTALAVEGYTLLGEALAGPDASVDLREMGVRYVRFAATHPAHFAVMFRPDLHRPDDPALVAARERTAALLRTGVGSLAPDRYDGDPALAALAAWLLAHGFATLWGSGSLDRMLDGRDPDATFREAAGLLFDRPGPGG
jgi:AcrR family transcriptional regulator